MPMRTRHCNWELRLQRTYAHEPLSLSGDGKAETRSMGSRSLPIEYARSQETDLQGDAHFLRAKRG